MISIRAPARGATCSNLHHNSTAEFQSALPRGERLCGAPHSPRVIEFQSALPRGERRSCCRYFVYEQLDFNPRSREGSDDDLTCLLVLSENFNPRSREGSDQKQRYKLSRTGYFNPRSREGSDIPILQTCLCLILFQSALPRGERHLPSEHRHQSKKFQSALPRGERHAGERLETVIRVISIRAPARGATYSPHSSFYSSYNFNPRSREGSDGGMEYFL